MSPPPLRYADSPSWRDYRALLPPSLAPRTDPEESSWRYRDDEVHLDTWIPGEPPRRMTVVLVHGGGGNGRILAPLASALMALGHRVVCPDLPGYGLTVRQSARPVTYGDWVDLVAALAEREAKSRGAPVALFGLSMGGLTAVHAALRAPCVAAVVATTLLDLSDDRAFDSATRTRWLGAASRWLFRVAPGSVDRISLPLRWLAPLGRMSSDPALCRYFTEDPLLGRLRVPLSLFRTARALPLPERARTDFDLLLAHPAADRWTPLELSQAVFDRLACRKERVVLEHAEHMPIELPGSRVLIDRTHALLTRIEATLCSPQPLTASPR